ncbi:histidine kinase N-terminal 7TM domain-containing protein [Halobaculum sp. MBLA0143]|uniref:histidine kinase N-terminal 7TM domain-containing protein n=1 Tax=Halobaculum sp. MBLA0143 TaxID=3079933 RepID=UPI003525A20B
MLSALSWPVVASLAAAVGTCYLIAALWRHRGAPGADWFLIVLGLQAAYTALYGVGFLVTDPGLRAAVEVGFWVVFTWLGPAFAAFALTYTGRPAVLRTRPFGVVVVVLLGVTVTLPFAPAGGLVWTGFEVAETAGVAGATYTRGPAIFLSFVANAALTAGGTVLLFDTVVSYGPLYRREAAAVGVSTLPPAVGATLWGLGLPVGGPNLMPVLALPHVLLDGYAYLASDLFEFDPATRRASERAAVDELATPVVVLDRESRVIRLNEAAADTLDTTRAATLGEPAATVGLSFDPSDPPESVELRVGGRRRTYRVTASGLRDRTDTLVGYTVVLQDITAERRRRQRLDVLNRVLRHNLRNGLSVVQLYAGQIADTGDGETPELAAEIERQADELLALGDAARRGEEALDAGDDRREVAVAALVSEAVDDHDDVDVRVPAELRLAVAPAPVTLAVANLVDNAVEHGAPPVTVSARADDDEAVIEIHDEGPGVPEYELAPLRADAETALEHGSGLGLWLVRWGVDAVGGGLAVDTSDGTTATVRVPGVVAGREAAAPARERPDTGS